MIWLAYACNDPANGQPLETLYVEKIQFDLSDCTLSLQGGRVKVTREFATRQGIDFHTLHVVRCALAIKDCSIWYGNWCWDAVLVQPKAALKGFNYLMKLKGWHCEQGPEFLHNAFNARRQVALAEWIKETR